jgi:quinol monooxygenase YgiN
MVVLAVTWMSNPGHEEEVADIFRKLQEASRLEPGCLMYVVHRHKDDPRRIFIYEQYRDDDALAAHRNSSHFDEYAVGALRKVASRMAGDLYIPFD